MFVHDACVLTIPLLGEEVALGMEGSFLCGREESWEEADDRPLAEEAVAPPKEAP